MGRHCYRGRLCRHTNGPICGNAQGHPTIRHEDPSSLEDCKGGIKYDSHDPKLLEKDLRYISPEQTGMMNREVDFRSDFYSLGIIFYRLLVGRHPFEGNSASKIIKMHVFHEIQPVHKIDPNIPLPVSDMISKLIERKGCRFTLSICQRYYA